MNKSCFRFLNRKIISAALALFLAGGMQTVEANARSTCPPIDQFFNHPSVKEKGKSFKSIATFDVMAENGSAVAEIIDVSGNGKQLVYTDSENEAIGFVSIKNPAVPTGEGTVSVGGEPTSLVVLKRFVLVGVNTSLSIDQPSGKLVVVNRFSRSIVAEYDLGGQPDSIALAPDKKRAVILLENERDEDLDDGIIPQNITGQVLIVSLKKRNPRRWTIKSVDLKPVADSAYAGTDLEPEFVDINKKNQAVVTFQENNHLAIIDIVTGEVVNHFSAGSADLENIDMLEDDLIILDSFSTKRREPDAVTWIDNDSFATANEGDYKDEYGKSGGSRGFTIFNQNGYIEYESGSSFEHLLTSVGHYNEGRSENKGVEPESIEFGVFGNRKFKSDFLFVGSERGNAVAVYEMQDEIPEFIQVLPTGIGPEGLKAIPQKNLFVASTEKDEAKAGIPTMINIYRFSRGQTNYPMIASEMNDGNTIPWVALSGLVGDPGNPDLLYTVNDSFLAEGFIYTIDVSSHPATIINRLQVTEASSSLDLEGIAMGDDGYFWAANEGKPGIRENAILKINPENGVVEMEIHLPPELANNAIKNGFEGIAVTGFTGEEIIYVAIQRAWPDAGDTDKKNTRIGRYDVAADLWSFVHYPLEQEGNGGWIGLSELTLLPNGDFAVIERDKGWGSSTGLNAELKSIYTIDLAEAEFYSATEELTTIEKTLLVDLLPEMDKRSIWTAEKLEGFAVAADGKTYCITDNDGLDDAPGETIFFSPGDIEDLLDR
ncbi:MAG: esterase-like activity of phytase family protein [Thermodesulfobacteriota bacterium]|nr:esterase-like activity of phytase family protein [Thermodesulfobacteriota bacterium]